MKKIMILLIGLLIMSLANAALFEEELSESNSNKALLQKEARFNLLVLKYGPFPVNPGDFFDVWIKAENIGNEDALNATFELVPKYPFSSTDELVKVYGRISGARGEEDENQVVIKYRVKTADNAPEGTNTLEIRFSPSEGIGKTTEKLEIEVGKTKTKFDVVMQDSTQQGTSLAIANIGENPAIAVTVRINKQEGFTLRGPQASIIGNLDKGDFTTVTFQIAAERNANELQVQVEYTDIAGVRNRITKKVPVDIRSSGLFSEGVTHEGGPGGFNRTSGGSLSMLLYVGIGVILSIVFMLIRKKIRKKKKI